MIDTEPKVLLISDRRLDGGRWMVDASLSNFQRLTSNNIGSARKNTLEQFKSMLLNNEDLSPEAIEKQIDKPDLIIIEGKKSLQNAAIIEASYAEIYFCDQLNETELARAVEDYKQRKRNFGV